jgi:hypothetical protein
VPPPPSLDVCFPSPSPLEIARLAASRTLKAAGPACEPEAVKACKCLGKPVRNSERLGASRVCSATRGSVLTTDRCACLLRESRGGGSASSENPVAAAVRHMGRRKKIVGAVRTRSYAHHTTRRMTQTGRQGGFSLRYWNFAAPLRGADRHARGYKGVFASPIRSSMEVLYAC